MTAMGTMLGDGRFQGPGPPTLAPERQTMIPPGARPGSERRPQIEVQINNYKCMGVFATSNV